MAKEFDFSHLKEPIESPLERFGRYAGNFNKVVEASRLPAFAGGLLQGTGDVAASAANLPLALVNKALGTDIKAPHPELRQFLPKDPITSAAFTAGRIGPEIAGATQGAGAAKNLLSAIPGYNAASKIPYVGKAGKAALEGAAGGAIAGETKEGNRELAAIAGALGIPVNKAFSYLRGLTPEKIGRKLLGAEKSAKEEYRGLYGDLFKEAEQKGIGNVPKPESNLDFIKENSPDKFHGGLEKFLEKPTPENAHFAQSDLGKLERHFKGIDETKTGLTSEQRNVYKEVKKAKKELQGHIHSTLGPELSGRYKEITAGYPEDVLIYGQSKEGKAAKRLIKELELSKKMQAKHPELIHQKQLEKAVNAGKKGTLHAVPHGIYGTILYQLLKGQG